VGEGWGVGVRDGGAVGSLTAWPHSLQNLVPGGCDEPHPWHIRAAWRAPPHSRQNFASAGLSSPHDGQSTILAPQLRGPPA